ncbi:N-carbamoyl-D-amino acid hydrolase [Xylophilus ampelinus]|nr:N-carbamoyl-D-amino acid hydrolase [Xylophilus ampelinus]
MSPGQSATRLRVACLQMDPRIGRKADNLARSLQGIADAAAAGARLVVLPELCNTGYVFQSRAEAVEAAEPVPDGPSCRAWMSAAARHGVVVVAGIAERVGERLYNAAAVLGPAGHLGTYRKNHLWDAENLFFEPGDLGMPVFEIEGGRFACAICYDMWFSEIYRMAAIGGADLLCVPTNWVPMRGQPGNLPMMANLLAMGGAHTNALFVAAADRIGVERGQRFLGSSLIVGPDGWPVAGPASSDAEEMLLADLDLSKARRLRTLNSFNHVLHDRRPPLYAAVLDAPRGP